LLAHVFNFADLCRDTFLAVMPASVADPVASVLRTALSGKRAPFSSESENGPELLEDRLAASAKRVLLSTIEYEPAPKQQVLALESLKSKYMVLNATQKNSSKAKAVSAISPTDSLPQPKVVLFRNEDVKIGWKSLAPVGAGMINMGNTCYMNSTLQALFHVPSFANWLFNGRHCKNCDPNGSQLCLICVIAKTLQTTHDKSGNITKPILVYNRLKLICKHMVHGRQEDAHEFMRYLIESLEKSYLHSVGGSKLDSRSKETNPLGQIFGGYIRTEVTCLKCKHTSTTFQHFQEIPLDIQHGSTLEDAMGHYFRRERLEGDNAYKCDKCKSKVPATKKFSIERAPNVLCIQLKRFGLMGGKMSKHINFSRQLNLNRFLFNPTSNGYVSYKFVSLINHMGPSQHCGHYTAIAEASNGQLYLFDDCSVRLVSLNVALSTTAYVLMYEKMHQSPKNMNGASKIQANLPQKVATTPKVAPSPRPALITEPERPKVNFQVKAKDAAPKPRLVIHAGNSLFKSTTATSSTNGFTPTPPSLPKTERNDKITTAAKTALVPYDTNSDEEDVSPAPTPKISTEVIGCNATSANWVVSENNQPLDNGSSSSSYSSGSGRWAVRSFSDTESGRSKCTDKRPSASHSDTELTAKTPPAVHNHDENKFSETIGSNKEKTNGEVVKAPTPEKKMNGREDVKAPTPEKKMNGREDVKAAASDGAKKWNGSLNTKSEKTDVVKELLKMSHSGYSDQVRTWDGGKSHVTRAVEDLKRVQRKRTYDDLLDGDMDKGKTKKIRVKPADDDASPSRNGHNPFQFFHDSMRNRQDQYHKSDHSRFKKDKFSRNGGHQNRSGGPHNRSGGHHHRGGRGGHRRGDHHRSQSKHHSNSRRVR